MQILAAISVIAIYCCNYAIGNDWVMNKVSIPRFSINVAGCMFLTILSSFDIADYNLITQNCCYHKPNLFYDP